jgi:hypothetical protein
VSGERCQSLGSRPTSSKSNSDTSLGESPRLVSDSSGTNLDHQSRLNSPVVGHSLSFAIPVSQIEADKLSGNCPFSDNLSMFKIGHMVGSFQEFIDEQSGIILLILGEYPTFSFHGVFSLSTLACPGHVSLYFEASKLREKSRSSSVFDSAIYIFRLLTGFFISNFTSSSSNHQSALQSIAKLKFDNP